MEPFIQNHQYNLIKYQAMLLQKQVHGVVDRDVESAIRAEAEAKVLDVFDELTSEQEGLLSRIALLNTIEERMNFLKDLYPFRLSFPTVTQQDVKNLFSKTKKLKLPMLKEIDFTSVTYLGWKDIGESKQYLVLHLNHKLVGLKGRYVIATRKGLCDICNRYGDMALVSFPKKGGAAENDKAYGKFICYDSKECNQAIQDPSKLEAFIHQLF